MGWQHHPPRHAAARAALGVQAAHATLGMAPPHMPPSSPRHANAKRARPRHRGEPSHATAVTPCPVHAAPRTRPMPPMRTRPPPHATSALPAHSAPSLPVSARPLERACCLGKTCQWPTSRLAPGGSPMPPARRCPSKGTRTPLPPCNECPPRALGPVSARRGALEPSSEHVASEKLANGQRRGSPRGLTHASRPTLPIERHTDAPPPHATRALPGCSAPRLGSSRSPQALERACCLGKNVPVANVAAHPGGSPMPPARRCPSKGTRMPLPPMQRVPSPGTRPRPGSSRSLQALERACCLRKEPDASSPCLYRSYEGFTRCSRVLVRSRLRTSRGSTRDAVS